MKAAATATPVTATPVNSLRSPPEPLPPYDVGTAVSRPEDGTADERSRGDEEPG